MGKKMSDLKKELLQDEEFRREYVRLDDEFALAAQLIEARKHAQFPQAQSIGH